MNKRKKPVGVVEAARLQRLVVGGERLDAHQVVEHEAHRREVRAVVELGDVRVVELGEHVGDDLALLLHLRAHRPREVAEDAFA